MLASFRELIHEEYRHQECKIGKKHIQPAQESPGKLPARRITGLLVPAIFPVFI